MEELFQLYKGFLVVHKNYQGIVCGYTDAHFILAVKTKSTDFFRMLPKREMYIEDKYRDPKYRYVFEDDFVIERQLKNSSNGKKIRPSVQQKQVGRGNGKVK
jgi:hypothetical protein